MGERALMPARDDGSGPGMGGAQSVPAGALVAPPPREHAPAPGQRTHGPSVPERSRISVLDLGPGAAREDLD